ncbi:MAG TPA: hypothetical protein VHY82_00680, partial [Acetobacteraceae bacterium]|nr:hypothetical protein [Acetobacteraceae bacterium]
MPEIRPLSRRTAVLSATAAAFALPWSHVEAAGEPVTILRVQRRSFEVNRKPASHLMISQL